MSRKTKKYTLNCVSYVEDIIPDNFVVIETYAPHSCPWDHYGNKQSREWCKVLAAAGVTDGGVYVIRKQGTKPFGGPGGTGPGGRVRMGDNMMPWTYRLCVPLNQRQLAINALLDHKIQVNEWLNHNGKFPEACKD